MIKKILVRDYLKGYGDMTTDEREAFVGRVGEWLAQDGARLLAMTDRPMARSQSLMTITTRWTSEDTKAVTDGIILMSALVGVADTWLPTQIYMKSAYRAIRQVVSVLSEVSGFKFQVSSSSTSEAAKPSVKFFDERSGKAERQVSSGVTVAPELPATTTTKTANNKNNKKAKNTETTEKVGSGVAGVNGTERTVADGQPQNPDPSRNVASVNTNTDGGIQPSSGMVPARPKHIDQYVHLLPKATQERAAEYGELMRQLGEARDNMQLLMDDGHASAKSREQWAKQATRIDKKIRALREELDREWEKVVADNRIALDAFGNAYVVEMRNEKGEMRNDDAAADTSLTSELSSEQRKRRRDLRKWLIDLRRGKEGKDRERRIEQWRVNWKEYLTLEPREKALQDEKILEAAKHFGIDIGGNTAEHETQDADGKE